MASASLCHKAEKFPRSGWVLQEIYSWLWNYLHTSTWSPQEGKFSWQDDHDKAFHQLKQALIIAPVLALSNFSQPFVLEMDASGKGIGVVLMQQGRPISYFSSSLYPINAALCTYEKEALEIL